MSKQVDERVVEMRFDNQNFEKKCCYKYVYIRRA